MIVRMFQFKWHNLTEYEIQKSVTDYHLGLGALFHLRQRALHHEKTQK